MTSLHRAPFRADHVGSFLRPKVLLEAHEQRQNGQITAEQLSQQSTFTFPIVIEPAQSITDGFTMNNASGCRGIPQILTQPSVESGRLNTACGRWKLSPAGRLVSPVTVMRLMVMPGATVVSTAATGVVVRGTRKEILAL